MKRSLIITLLSLAIAIIVIATSVSIYNEIQKPHYTVISFSSEDEMRKVINGSWNFYTMYMNFGDVCISWKEPDESLQIEEYSLDYLNGRIVLNNNYYYEVIKNNDVYYINITPKAKKKSSTILYKKSYVQVP